MRLGTERPGQVARVEHQPRLADEADGVELAMRGEDEDQIVGAEGGGPVHRGQGSAPHRQGGDVGVGIVHARAPQGDDDSRFNR